MSESEEKIVWGLVNANSAACTICLVDAETPSITHTKAMVNISVKFDSDEVFVFRCFCCL